ncbi:AcrR family transcriptional regulator [Saccharopolyspora lacisalsi]|uniref:AcrR family transcriptional regulator n=1 Tax=Halosaccharopolyspora lacisalsi TaxID=1000566 RepID=A0A839E256_9PSEU|nr:TetR family transcriptional regulator [Halosaccharopolyspora lacisalsi]MBA8825815.1 AcrR family transcriptional regulator [Halosaccharopolyspora lacisalsi]
MNSDRGDGSDAPRRRGRRSGGEDTRAALLEAAREIFVEQGYNGATVRAIATRAGVDPAMVNHWFGSKAGLFTASISLPFDPREVLSHLLEGDPERLAERMVREFLTAWDTAGGGQFIALVRSVATHDTAGRMLREFVTTLLFGRLITALGMDQPQLRAALCGSQISGLGMMRYVVKLEPLASADHGTVIAAIAPTLQRYLTGDLTGVSGE